MKRAISIAIAAIMGMGLMFGTGCSHKHEFGEWKTVVPATCVREGSERRDCRICDFSQTRTVEKTEHTTDQYSADSSKHWKECAVCHKRIDESAHTFEGTTCTVCQYDKTGTASLQYKQNGDGSFSVVGVLGTAPEEVVIPDYYVEQAPVTSIAKGAFVGQAIMKQIRLPEHLVSIEDGAFDDCSALQSIDIPASVTAVSNNAFTGCPALESVTVAPENAYYTAEGGILYDKPKTKFIFVPPALKGELVIPEGITKVGNGIFSGCGLERVTIGPQVTEIALHAFLNCKSLKDFVVQGSETVIGKAVLSGCTSLQKLVLANTWQQGLTTPMSGIVSPNDRATGDSYIGYIFGAALYLETGSVVPASLETVEFTGGTRLYNYTFYSCASLKSVTIPSSVEAIEDRVFVGCTSLASVTIAAENQKYSSQSNVIYNKTASGGITSIKFIPEALSGDIVIPEGVTVIESGAFRARAIETLSLPATLRQIGSYAFTDCHSLTEVTIPDDSKLVSFDDNCFSTCDNLRSITIPAKVTDIRMAFVGCRSLAKAEFKAASGWVQIIDRDNTKPIPAEDLADPNLAARYLTSALGGGYSWRRESA